MNYLERIDKNFYKRIPTSIECKNFCLTKVNAIYFCVDIADRYVDIYCKRFQKERKSLNNSLS